MLLMERATTKLIIEGHVCERFALWRQKGVDGGYFKGHRHGQFHFLSPLYATLKGSISS